jgi:PAS domain S-box-containing protein
MLDEVNRSGSVQTLWEHPEDRQAFIEKIKASPGRYCEQEARFRRKDGSLLEAYLSMMLTTDLILNEPYLVGFIYDITERKRAEAALRLSLDQLRANLENTPNVAVQWFDEVGRVLYWNPASEAMYGWSAAETLGKTLEAFAYSREEGREFQEVLQRVRTTGSPVGPSELHIHRKDGSECWVMSTTFTMPLGEGRIGCVSMDVDITERKQAEEGKERLNAQLLQAQKMEVVGRLAGGVAHDFNNMLGVILGRADLALSLVDPGNAVHNSLKEILKAARHSADLTRQLLAFARQQAVAPRILDLNDTVEGMLKVLRRLIGEHIELAWMPSAALWPLRMDPSQIDQILANLCVNARDAIQGVGRIRLETRNVSVDEEYCAAHFGAVPGEYVQLTVNDNGRGMAAEVLEHLFEPFFTTKGLGRGTGLGLATVYGIVQQNEGFIHVYSELGHGSTFRIYLPRSAQEAPEDPQEPKARMPRGHGELLLMVEDDEALRTFSRDALLSLGYRVLDAGFPLEALQLEEAHRGQIRLLVTDVIMPGMNGRELAERLRARQPELLCLFISGYTADIITEQGVLAEGLAFLQKPYSLRELAAKVHEMLDAG